MYYRFKGEEKKENKEDCKGIIIKGGRNTEIGFIQKTGNSVANKKDCGVEESHTVVGFWLVRDQKISRPFFLEIQ